MNIADGMIQDVLDMLGDYNPSAVFDDEHIERLKIINRADHAFLAGFGEALADMARLVGPEAAQKVARASNYTASDFWQIGMGPHQFRRLMEILPE